MTPPQNGTKVTFEPVTGYGPARARNIAANRAIDGGFDYVLYVDSDQILPPDTLCKLTKTSLPIIAGWSMMAINDERTNVSYFNEEQNMYDFIVRKKLPSKGRIVVDAIGFSCIMVDVKVFNKIPYPYFRYVEYENKTTLSEDLYFCDQVRKAGIPLMCDTTLKIGHLKQVVL